MCRGQRDSGSSVPSESTPCGPLRLWAMLLATWSTKPLAAHKRLAGRAAADSVSGCPRGQAVEAKQQVCTALTMDAAHKPVGHAIRSSLFLDAFQESLGNCTSAEPLSCSDLGHLTNMPGTICGFLVCSLFRIFF